MHTAGVSLIVRGEVAPSNSLVDVDDVLFTVSDSQNPTSDRPDQHDQSLLCVTDLVNCCETEMLGNWYFPNGDPVTDTGDPSYQSNRGQNEERNGRQFYGSVRLFRRHVPPSENGGPFRCVLPDRFNVNQTLNAYIGEIFMAIHFVVVCELYNVFHSEFCIQPLG